MNIKSTITNIGGSKMKTFKIPCSWEVYGTLKIEANTLEEAKQKAITEQETCSLPESNYIDGSFKLDLEDDNLIEVLNEF